MFRMAALLVLLSPALSAGDDRIASAEVRNGNFRLEGYDKEANDGVVNRAAATVNDAALIEFRACRVTDQSLKIASQWKGVKRIVAFDTAITGDGLANFKDHTDLTQLKVIGPNVSDDGLRHLNHFQNVTHLSVGNGYRWDGVAYDAMVTDATLERISKMKAVQFLAIDNALITDRGIQLLQNMPNLRSVIFLRCPNLTMDGIERLKSAMPRVNLQANCK